MPAPEPQLIDAAPAMRAQTRAWRLRGQRTGLVPTMGCLHEGHLSLVRACQAHCDRTVVSIYVNPLQFGPGEDYDVYPRRLQQDRDLLAALGVDAVFHPTAFYAPDHATHVEVQGLTSGLCGAARPGHFRGVTTVVAKLFHAVDPDVAVFGHKDYQQAVVIRRMVRDLDMGIDIVIAPTVREADGLAMSSRNARLDVEERRRAPVIFQALDAARQAIEKGLEDDGEAIRQRIRQRISTALSPRLDYVEVVDPESLEPVSRISGPVIMAVAVRLSSARLIDNMAARPPT